MNKQETEKLLMHSLLENGIKTDVVSNLENLKKAMYQFHDDMKNYEDRRLKFTLAKKQKLTAIKNWLSSQPDFVSVKSVTLEITRVVIKNLQVNTDRKNGIFSKHQEFDKSELYKILGVDVSDLMIIQGDQSITGGVLNINLNIYYQDVN